MGLDGPFMPFYVLLSEPLVPVSPGSKDLEKLLIVPGPILCLRWLRSYNLPVLLTLPVQPIIPSSGESVHHTSRTRSQCSMKRLQTRYKYFLRVSRLLLDSLGDGCAADDMYSRSSHADRKEKFHI